MRLSGVNGFIISGVCIDVQLLANLGLYHIELLPYFFYQASFFCFIPCTNVNISPSFSVPDIASRPCQQSGRSMRCSGNPSENLEHSIF